MDSLHDCVLTCPSQNEKQTSNLSSWAYLHLEEGYASLTCRVIEWMPIISSKPPCSNPLRQSCQRLEKTLRVPYLVLPWPLAPLHTWCCQSLWDPSSCSTSTPSPHSGRPKSSREASGANSCGCPTCRGGDKTTIETQGQCG